MFLTQNVSPDRRDPQMGITVWPKENGKKIDYVGEVYNTALL